MFKSKVISNNDWCVFLYYLCESVSILTYGFAIVCCCAEIQEYNNVTFFSFLFFVLSILIYLLSCYFHSKSYVRKDLIDYFNKKEIEK